MEQFSVSADATCQGTKSRVLITVLVKSNLHESYSVLRLWLADLPLSLVVTRAVSATAELLVVLFVAQFNVRLTLH